MSSVVFEDQIIPTKLTLFFVFELFLKLFPHFRVGRRTSYVPVTSARLLRISIISEGVRHRHDTSANTARSVAEGNTTYIFFALVSQ